MYQSLTGSRWDDLSALNRHNSRGGRWFRLPDAPFSPRAYMAHDLQVFPPPNDFGAPTPPAWYAVLVVHGGETGYACNQRRLGVCSDDIWQLSVCRLGYLIQGLDECGTPDPDADWQLLPELGLAMFWNRAFQRMPGPRRCSFIPIFERRQGGGVYFASITGIGGGQRSYDDPTCTAPIQTLDDLWFSFWPYYTYNWTQSARLPFLPRRSAALDDALVSTDEMASYDESPIDKSVTVAGGIAYTQHRFDAATNRSVITRAQLYADAWSCLLVIDYVPCAPPLVCPFVITCDWHYSYPLGRLNVQQPAAPSGSLPLPLASSASALFPTGRDLLNMRVGGGTAALALQQLTALRLDNGSAAHVRLPLPPVSLLRQPNSYRSRRLPFVSVDEVAASRYHLPLLYELGEVELEDDTAALATGTELLISHTLLYAQGHAKALFTTWDDASIGPTLAAPVSAASTSVEVGVDGSARALQLNFSLRRVEHSMASTWDTAIISGGRSGSVYLNDWLTFEAGICFWPDDPSYLQQLGAMRFRGEVQQLSASYRRYYHAPQQLASPDEQLLSSTDTAMFRAGVEVEVACAPGWHFHPPLASEVAVLTCAASSQWLDVDLTAVRRCVPDELQCAPPLVDAGYSACVDPLPAVLGIEVVTAVANWREQPVNLNPATVVSVPAAENAEVTGELLLVVRGEWLCEPLAITVGSVECLQPLLRDVKRSCTSSGCVDYARTVVCLLSRDIGVGELVTVRAGRAPRAVTLSSLRLDPSVRGRQPLTVSADEPSVVSLTAEAGRCSTSSSSREQLTGCSSGEGMLQVEVCGINMAHRYLASTSLITAYVNVTVASEEVPCSGWRFDFDDVGQCNASEYIILQCYTRLLCGTCEVQPVMSKSVLMVALWSRWPTGPLLSNSRQQAEPTQRSFISFDACPPGSFLVINASSSEESCEPCQPGTYSKGGGAQSCLPCARGSFSDAAGSTDCQWCAPGSSAPEAGMTQCLACNGSSWQPALGEVDCKTCDGGQYRILPSLPPALSPPTNSSSSSSSNGTIAPSNSSSSSSSFLQGATDGRCLLCPDGAECYSNGVLVAEAGFYLVVTNHLLGTIEALACSSACGGLAATNSSTVQLSQRVDATGVSLINSCSAHRLLDSSNLLCAECEPEYSDVRGRCVYCPSPSYGWLAFVLLLSGVLVYSLHLSTLNFSNASTISIMVYFVQMFALFLPANFFAPLNLLNLQLFGGLGTESTCLVPWDGLGALLGRVVSPLVVLTLLAAILGLQLALRKVTMHAPPLMAPRLIRTYRLLFPPRKSTWSSVNGVEAALSPSSSSSPREALLSPLRQSLLDGDEYKLLGDRSKCSSHRSLLDVATAASAGANGGVGEPLEVDDTAEVDAAEVALPDESVMSILRDYRWTLLRLLAFSYNSFAGAALSFFHSRRVGEYERRLWEYPAVSTASKDYLAMLPFMALQLTVSVAVIPLLAVYFYRYHRHEQRRLAKLLTGMEEEEEEGKEAAPQREAVLVEVMTSTFRAGYWPLAVMVLFRRLLLTIIATFVVTNSYVWLTSVNTLLLVLHVWTWPYRDARDNYVEALTLTLLVLETTLLSDGQLQALLLSSSQPTFLYVMLWLVLLLPFVVVVCVSVRTFYIRAREDAVTRTGSAGVVAVMASALALLVCPLSLQGQAQPGHLMELHRQASGLLSP